MAWLGVTLTIERQWKKRQPDNQASVNARAGWWPTMKPTTQGFSTLSAAF
jgi:hypothetical protein